MWSGVAGTLVVHAGAVLALLLSVRAPPRSLPPTYAVELVAAPTSPGAARPAPAAPAAPAVPRVPPRAARKPLPATKAPPRSADRREPVPRATSRAVPLPNEAPGTGSDLANVRLQGKEFPYPEYLQNLVTQIYRRWNRPQGNSVLTAEVGFVILRDGTVRNIQVLSSSRSYSFDLEARGAIEATAAAKAFGPLPSGYPADYLQISFTFAPRQGR